MEWLTRRKAKGQTAEPAQDWTPRNRRTDKDYSPHHADEADALTSDSPRYIYVKGGEGSGKSVFGVIKSLRRLAAGCDGIMVSPDLPHFKRSLWPEFRNWCPPEILTPEHRYRLAAHWQPGEPFVMSFVSGSHLYCGGIEDPGAWEGPNVNFAHFDEARRVRSAGALKVLDGRIRIPGPGGQKPQLWITTTPRKNWLYEYFGPWERIGEPDPRAAFKRASRVVSLRTIDNERAGNLEPGYTQARAQSLTEAEARVLLEAEWEDIDDVDRFLPSMSLWDACREDLPPLTRHEPMVIALDAAVSNDSFGLVAVTRHPRDHERVAVRHVQEWRPVHGVIDYDAEGGPRQTLDALISSWDVVLTCYDPFQLHQLMTQYRSSGRVYVSEFNQGAERLEADKQLLDVIMQRKIAHDGNAALRAHIDNADRKPDPETRKLRIIKREQTLKIDLAVCTSMAVYRCLLLPI